MSTTYAKVWTKYNRRHHYNKRCLFENDGYVIDTLDQRLGYVFESKGKHPVSAQVFLDKNDYGKSVSKGGFQTIEEAKAWVETMTALNT